MPIAGDHLDLAVIAGGEGGTLVTHRLVERHDAVAVAVDQPGGNAGRQQGGWIAVAIALGYVRLNVVLGGYVFRESTADERVLNRDERSPERSREQARDEFLRQGLTDPFRRVLTAELAKGTEGLYTRLQEWLEKESRNLQDKEYPAAFRADVEQVSEYAKSIRWN